MAENQWKKPKDIGGNLQWKNGLSWRDVYFQVSASTIYLYPKNRKVGNQLLKKISFTEIEEISNVEAKFSKRYLLILLKTGIIEQFKCPNMSSLEVQQWIDNLRHALKFWTDKERLKQRKGPQRTVTLEESNEPSKCLNEKEHRVFFTLWNEEMIGLLVNAASTFTDIYTRLFSLACEPSSCSICKIRHQSCDLWAVDISGTARRVGKDEILADLEKSGNRLFVMEHHQKLLVVHFLDFSYESLPAPVSITATQVLKLEQIASKLNELGCFDPGLFLREESGNELQFCMNDNPFKFHERGKIVARSKRIQRNSVKKSDHEKIAELRWKEYRRFVLNQKTSDALRKSHADQIQKSCNMDEELCFLDDHFALYDNEMGNARGTQAQNKQRMQNDKEEYQQPNPDQYPTKSVGNDGHCWTNFVTCPPSDSTCPSSNILRQESLDGDWVSVHNDDITSRKLLSNDSMCSKINSDVANSVKSEIYVSTPRKSSSNCSFGDKNRNVSDKSLPDGASAKHNNGVTNLVQRIINAKPTSESAHYSPGKSDQDVSNMASPGNTSTKNNNDVANVIKSTTDASTPKDSSTNYSFGDSNQDVSDVSNKDSPDDTSTENDNDVANLAESTVDARPTSKSSHDSVGKSDQDVPNMALPDSTSTKNNDGVTNLVESTIDAGPTSKSSHESVGKNDQNVSNMVSPNGTSTENNNDVAILVENSNDAKTSDSSSNYSFAHSNHDDSNRALSDGTSTKNGNEVANLIEGTINAKTTSKSSHYSIAQSDQDAPNMASPDSTSTKNNVDVTNLAESTIDATPTSKSSHDIVGRSDQDVSNMASPNGTSTKNKGDVTNSVASTIHGKSTSDSSHSHGKSDQDLSSNASPDGTRTKSNDDLTNLVESSTGADTLGDSSSHNSVGKSYQNLSNETPPDGTSTKDNSDIIVLSNDNCNENDTPDQNLLTNTPILRDIHMASDQEANLATPDRNTNSNDLTNITDRVCVENKGDVKDDVSFDHILVKSTHEDTSVPSLGQENFSSTRTDATDINCFSNSTTPDPIISSSPGKQSLIHSQSDGLVFRKERHSYKETSSYSSENRVGMRRALSDLNIRYSFTSVKAHDTRSMSESDLLDKGEDARVADVYTEESLDDSDKEVFRPTKVSTLTGPTWTFAKRVEDCVRKILLVRDDISEVERLIAKELCQVLFEFLNHGLKKSFLGISFFASGPNVWRICQIVCKETNIAAGEIERIKEGRIEEKFHLFIRECIRKQSLSRWFEVLSTEKVQKRIMKHYEPSAVVLEPEHSKAMEHLKIHLDGLGVLKLKALKARQSRQNMPPLVMFE